MREAEADYGMSGPDSFAQYDRESSSWKTSQLCLDGEWAEFSETWPRAGTISNGIAYQRRPLAPLTRETGSGLWLTPRAKEAAERPETFLKRHPDRGEHCRCSLSAQVMWPTPCAMEPTDNEKIQYALETGNLRMAKGYKGNPRRLALGETVIYEERKNEFPTPTRSDANEIGRASCRERV